MRLFKTPYEKFDAAFHKRYKTELKADRQPTPNEMAVLFCYFKSVELGHSPHGLKPDAWFQQQEGS